jgi:rubrerythrin
MNILAKIKNQLKNAIDDIHNDYEAKIQEIENANSDCLESYENYDFKEDEEWKKETDAFEKKKLEEELNKLNKQKWHCIRCGYLLKFINRLEAFCTNKECVHNKYSPLEVKIGDSYSVSYVK